VIPVIRELYLRMVDDHAACAYESEHPEIWEFSQEEVDYLEQIKTVDDLLNYTPSPDGRMQALAYDCALAMGLSQHDAMSAANDH